MLNPFSPPIEHRPGPLCPWRLEKHLDYYVAVDHSEEAFSQFRTELQRWSGALSRKAIMISGEDGCGKSSLIHRCVRELKERCREHHEDKVWLVDLLQEPHGHGRTIPQKVKYIMDELVDQMLDAENIFSEDDRNFIASAKDDVHAARRLSRRLAKNGAILLLMLPKIELSQEINEYMTNYFREGIVLFLETSELSLSGYCASRFGADSTSPIFRLQVTKIIADDGNRYKNARLLLLSSSLIEQVPRFDDQIMEDFMEKRVKGSFGISIKELEMVCEYAFASALQRADGEVCYADIANYYIENGRF
jgi:hypothetical protein